MTDSEDRLPKRIPLSQKKSIYLADMHNRSRHNRLCINKSEWCSCFSCCQKYKANEVREWIDTGNTALCPKCGIDAVIGDYSGYDDMEDMKMMYNYYFGVPNEKP